MARKLFDPNTSTPCTYYWACEECLSYHYTCDRVSALKHAKAHMHEFGHAIETRRYVAELVCVSSGVHYPPKHPSKE